jgi:DNA-binding HxlR family transcriptional regulator/putative sterol carrier protein
MRRGKRSYDQYCALARALDVIGERWTLLIVRELLLGPKRYRDLLEALSGIGTNLLAQRLRELQEVGLVERRLLPAPAGVRVYALTDQGLGLEEAVLSLGRWGAAFLGVPRPADRYRAGWYVLSMLATFRAAKAAELEETFELRVRTDVFEVRVASGEVSAEQVSAARRADSVIETDVDGLLGLLSGSLSPAAALELGHARVTGAEGALERFVELFGWPTAEAERAA